jgi:hypothetical protein
MRAMKSFTIMVVMVALSEVAWLGCGVKSMPISPEAARPAPIVGLEATSQKSGVRLTWDRPDKYASGDTMKDLGGFTIARTEGEAPFQKLGEIPVTDNDRFQVQRVFTYIDKGAEVGKTYRYEVTSNTTDGYVSAPSNEVTIVRKVPPPPPSPETFTLPTPTPLP